MGSIEKVKGVQRYMLEAARVTQAQQQKELHPGTEAGLAAVTRELFVTSEVRPGGGFFWGCGGLGWFRRCFLFHKACQAQVSWCPSADRARLGGAGRLHRAIRVVMKVAGG